MLIIILLFIEAFPRQLTGQLKLYNAFDYQRAIRNCSGAVTGHEQRHIRLLNDLIPLQTVKASYFFHKNQFLPLYERKAFFMILRCGNRFMPTDCC